MKHLQKQIEKNSKSFKKKNIVYISLDIINTCDFKVTGQLDV